MQVRGKKYWKCKRCKNFNCFSTRFPKVCSANNLLHSLVSLFLYLLFVSSPRTVLILLEAIDLTVDVDPKITLVSELVQVLHDTWHSINGACCFVMWGPTSVHCSPHPCQFWVSLPYTNLMLLHFPVSYHYLITNTGLATFFPCCHSFGMILSFSRSKNTSGRKAACIIKYFNCNV